MLLEGLEQAFGNNRGASVRRAESLETDCGFVALLVAEEE